MQSPFSVPTANIEFPVVPGLGDDGFGEAAPQEHQIVGDESLALQQGSARSEMQDAAAVYHLGDGAVKACVIADGHGPRGREVAEFVVSAFGERLRALANPARMADDDVSAALAGLFDAVQQMMVDGDASANEQHFAVDSGATVIVVFRRDTELWVASAGDCWCCVWRRGAAAAEARSLVPAHNHSNPAEADRVTKCGDAFDRAYLRSTQTAVSRALGHLFARASAPWCAMTHEPAVVGPLHAPRGSVVLAGSDGRKPKNVLSVMTGQGAAAILAEAPHSGDDAALYVDPVEG